MRDEAARALAEALANVTPHEIAYHVEFGCVRAGLRALGLEVLKPEYEARGPWCAICLADLATERPFS